MNRLPLSGSDAAGESAAQFRAGLQAICADVELHARLLNTLSLLEHIGSRKIMLARGAALDGRMLQHLAEETRHAYFFKRAAEKIAQRSLDYGGACTLAGAAARFYMGRLDYGVNSALPSGSSLPYLYMSLVIEDRAIWAYRIYQRVLSDAGCGISLKPVLAEEKLHLHAMLNQIEADDAQAWKRIPEFCALEHLAFERLWNAIEQDCAGSGQHARAAE
jgi:hypothetical protein